MDVRIGVLHTPKEIEIELPADAAQAEIRSRVDSAMADGSVLWLVDRHGAEYGIPVDRIAWVQIGSPDADRRIGFGT